MIDFVKDIVKFMLWFPLRWTLPLFPLNAVYFIGNIGGNIHLRFSGNLRKAMHEELSIIFSGKYSDEEKKSVIRRTYKIMAKNQLEVLQFRSLTERKTKRIIRVEGLEKIDLALSNGKGVVLLIAHFGANKLVMPALGFRGYRINQVAGKPTEWIRIMGDEISPVSKKIFELEIKNEQCLPANFIYVFKSMKPIFRYLKNNEIVCMAIDGGGGTKKEEINFLGRKAMVSAGPFRIAQKTEAAILPAFVVRQQDDTHRLIIEDPIEAEPNLTEEENNVNNLQKFMKILEEYVGQYPCHYAFRLARARLLCRKDQVPLFKDYEREKA